LVKVTTAATAVTPAAELAEDDKALSAAVADFLSPSAWLLFFFLHRVALQQTHLPKLNFLKIYEEPGSVFTKCVKDIAA
jgi:hypothetical protein